VVYGDDVEELSAGNALSEHEPQVGICSWPPANNPFERQVFLSPSVECYIVIGSNNKMSFGN
jgi:hypothetical protein